MKPLARTAPAAATEVPKFPGNEQSSIVSSTRLLEVGGETVPDPLDALPLCGGRARRFLRGFAHFAHP